MLETVAQTTHLEALRFRLQPLYNRLATHPLYRSFYSIEHIRLFMETHVFAVWDFMSLLKTLQRGLTTVDVPWLPTPDAASRRLINEIVLGEESDLYEGRSISHFELYLEAMRACGASTKVIESFTAALQKGTPLNEALELAPAAARIFVTATFRVVDSSQLHTVAAAFTFGREDLIPDIFRGFIRDQDAALKGQLTLLRWYLDRHIEVDSEDHGPMALRMVCNLCGEDAVKWNQAGDAAAEAVEARLALWDAITAQLAASR